MALRVVYIDGATIGGALRVEELTVESEASISTFLLSSNSISENGPFNTAK